MGTCSAATKDRLRSPSTAHPVAPAKISVRDVRLLSCSSPTRCGVRGSATSRAAKLLACCAAVNSRFVDGSYAACELYSMFWQLV